MTGISSFTYRRVVHRHLVVPGAGGVQALARVPDALGEQGLDVHVDVLIVHGELHLVSLDVRQDGLQALHDLLYLMLLNDPLLASIWAWAMDPAMSCLYSRASNWMEGLKSLTNVSVSF